MNAEESYKRRKKLLMAYMEETGFDVVLFVNEAPEDNGHPPSPNLLYMCGMVGARTPKKWPINGGRVAYILDKNGETSIVVSLWFAPSLKSLGYYDHVVSIKRERSRSSVENHVWAIKDCIEKFHPKGKIGIDLTTTSAMFASLLKNALKIPVAENVDVHEIVCKLRVIKDDYELAEISKAIDMTEKAILEVVLNSKPGVNMHDLIKQAQARAIREGAVHSFPNFLGQKREGVIKYGDLLSLDIGCRVPSGYFSDMGRVIPMSGSLTPNVKNFLEKKVEVHKQVIKFFKDGVTPDDIVAETNKLHEEFRLAPILSFGHHIGLEIHDIPNQIEIYKQPLQSGMVLTYEPYAKDIKTGLSCHIEDEILVTPNGGKVMSHLPWDLLW